MTRSQNAKAFALPLPDPVDFSFEAADGYPLAGTRYPAASGRNRRLVVAGATGVPQRFYQRFATHAQAAGYEVWTFDYRGIARSAPRSLAGFDASFTDWGRLDFSAAVTEAAADGPVDVVGHSFGGHALGMVREPQLISAAFIFGVGAGWAGYMPRSERLRVWALWNVIFPGLVRWKGYAPWSLLGMGEDIPLGVHRQWRRWCSFPHYFFDDPKDRDRMCRDFARLRFPIRFENAMDDVWAPPNSRDALLAGFRNAACETGDVDPEPYSGLGHMGYFREQARPLWDHALEWLEGRAAEQAESEERVAAG